MSKNAAARAPRKSPSHAPGRPESTPARAPRPATLDAATLAAIEEVAQDTVRELLAKLGDGTFVPPEYLTPDQAASLTGFAIKTLEFWRTRRDGGLIGEIGPPFVRIANRWIRYERRVLLTWMRALTIGDLSVEQPEPQARGRAARTP